MKITKLMTLLAVPAVLSAGLLFVFTGCEDEADTDVANADTVSSATDRPGDEGNLAVEMEIIPSSTTFTSGYNSTNSPTGTPIDLNGAIVEFRVVGGSTPYGDWMSSSTDLGTVQATGEDTARYTVSGLAGIGDSIVSVVDAQGRVVTATVTLEWKED